jgi:hypothetical protein
VKSTPTSSAVSRTFPVRSSTRKNRARQISVFLFFLAMKYPGNKNAEAVTRPGYIPPSCRMRTI